MPDQIKNKWNIISALSSTITLFLYENVLKPMIGFNYSPSRDGWDSRALIDFIVYMSILSIFYYGVGKLLFDKYNKSDKD